jgi:hypothetical protein
MRSSDNWICRPIAICLILMLAIPWSDAGLAMAQQATSASSQGASSATAVTEHPAAKTSTETAAGGNSLPENPAPASQQAPTQSGQESSSQSGSTEQQNAPAKPLGTAVAPYERTMGIAASRPAGAAIAPAKQRRVRTIWISLGVVAGAAIAVGSVAALSHGSPSRP